MGPSGVNQEVMFTHPMGAGEQTFLTQEANAFLQNMVEWFRQWNHHG